MATIEITTEAGNFILGIRRPGVIDNAEHLIIDEKILECVRDIESNLFHKTTKLRPTVVDGRDRSLISIALFVSKFNHLYAKELVIPPSDLCYPLMKYLYDNDYIITLRSAD